MSEIEEIEKLKTEIERLKNMNEIKSDLISISAHQLRTSLSALKWILKMFLDKDFGSMTPEQESFMHKAYDSNERLISFVNEMLTLNHSEDTSMKYNYKEVDVLKITEELLFDFSGESFKKGVEIIFLRPSITIPKIEADEEKVRVVFQNLIENAIKYSDKGDKVFISLHAIDDGIEFSVKDTGIGISENEKDKIFDKFFRADNAKTKDSIGSGLGLYTTKNILERHNGKIRFESNTNGTTFFVDLPLQKENA